VLGKIIQGAPVSATGVRKSIPLNVDAAIRKALEKIPADRFSTAQGFAKALADPSFRHGEDERDTISAAGTRWRNAAIAASLVALILAGVTGASLLSSDPPPPVERFSMRPVDGQSLTPHFAVSNDGRMIVFQMQGEPTSRLALRRLGSIEPTPVPGTENALFPVLSPDGTEVGFVQGGSLKVAPLTGGVVRTLTDSVACCTRWGPDGFIYFSTPERAMARVPIAGGDVERVTDIPEDVGEQHGDFTVVPGEDMAFFTVWTATPRVDAIRLSTGERKAVTTGVKPFVTDAGHLVFGSIDGQILVARFDPATMELSTPAVPLVEGVRVDSGNWPFYAVGPNGDLVYWTGESTAGTDGRVVRVDRSGNLEPIDDGWLFDPGTPEVSVQLSPNGRHLAVKITGDEGDDIWVKELDDGPLSRLTFAPEADFRPNWSRDGQYIYFVSFRDGDGDLDLWRRRWDGTSPAELVLDFENRHVAEAILNREGTAWILRLGGSNVTGTQGIRDIVGMAVGDSVLYPVASEPYDEKAAKLSPDGRWLAYESTETGRDEVYIRPYPNVTDGKWQVSTEGAINPVWARNGRELFYISQDMEMTVAELQLGDDFRVLSRQPLFSVADRQIFAQSNYASYDVALDDQSLYMVQFGAGAAAEVNEFVLVQNWLTEIEERLPR
ncbi:MAG: hypothetical protein R3253_04925, partial [Longimicrobiales bacterium]|nr:hypothetical protein [Longimicrobiales bacterium]